MKRFVFQMLIVAGLVAVASADDRERGPAKACTSYKLETPYRGLGYDHVVTVKNECRHTERCEIEASTHSGTLELEVPGESTRSITVRRGSPARVFEARVTCKKK